MGLLTIVNGTIDDSPITLCVFLEVPLQAGWSRSGTGPEFGMTVTPDSGLDSQ